MKHVIVQKEAGKSLGWPANNGIWSWENEVVVGFSKSIYEEKIDGHSIDSEQPQLSVLARSPDGGETWMHEQPENYANRIVTPLSEAIYFAHHDLAIRCDGSIFRVSYDRCRSWQGLYSLPDFALKKKLTSRTDYIVNSKRDCFFFLSVREPRVQASLADRAFCARTSDGGRTFNFLSWMLPEPEEVRSVMPSTVRLSQSELVSALRRRVDVEEAGRTNKKCWIDLTKSQDNGRTWGFLSKVADTDSVQNQRNGNPPSLSRLPDGRLCVTYGFRSTPFGMRAKISSDNGRTWGEEIVLRDDARTWDFGYPRSVVRPAGKVLTVYYYTTKGNPQQHIAATIWDPDEVSG